MATRSGTIAANKRVGGGRSRATRVLLHPGHPAVLIAIVAGLLVITGLVMIFSSSFVTSLENTGSSFAYFQKQLLWTLVGIVGFVVAARMDYRHLRRFGIVLYLGCAAMLVAVLLPGVGITAGGSSRWLGAGALAFQPSEPAKLALILFGAQVFTRKKEETFEDLGHTVVPMIPAIGIMAALVLWQPDLGTTMLLGAIGIGMLFVAGAPLRHLIPISSLGAGVAFAAAMIEPYRRARILSFLDPWRDPLNTGYQTIQSLIALGSGGVFGVGLGASRQKWLYVPNAHTDFIFAILGEEMGLIGTFTVVGLFAFFTYLGIKTAQRAPDRFGMLVAAGITIWISTQAIVNMGAVAAALPITGVPLPLVSFGGTSLVISLIAIGILVNIAMQGRHSRPRRQRRAGPR